MAKLEVHSGDFSLGHTTVLFGRMILRNPVTHSAEPIAFREIARIELTPLKTAPIKTTVRWETVAGSLQDTIDLISGAEIGSDTETVTFRAVLKDGRHLLASTDRATFEAMEAQVARGARSSR